MAVLAVLLLATLVGGFFVSKPYWLYVSRGDLGVPRGFYRCHLYDDAASRVRQCNIGADGLVFREETRPDGTVHRQWFAHGRVECVSETVSPAGERIAGGHDTCRQVTGAAP